MLETTEFLSAFESLSEFTSFATLAYTPLFYECTYKQNTWKSSDALEGNLR
jgi:hypothetical protein